MDPIKQFYDALNRVGILNYRNMQETGEARFLQRCLGGLDAPVVLDVGANVGAYSKAALEVCPSATVIAFEPHPTTFRTLTAADARIRTCNFALGDREETADFYDYHDEDGSEHASLYKQAIEDVRQRPSRSCKVPVRRLDAVAAELGLTRVRLLKVDTEGHEMAVFRGGEGLIRSGAVETIQFEFNDTSAVSRTFFKDFWDFLPDYNFYRLMPNGVLHFGAYNTTFCEVFAFQNIVCVKKGLSLF